MQSGNGKWNWRENGANGTLGPIQSPVTERPILYSFRRCPYAMRARMALLVSGVAFELREILLRDKPPEMLALSPKGTVPVLVLPDGRVIDESLDVMRWALEQNDPERWLDGADDALIAANDGPFKAALDRYKYPHRYDADPHKHRDSAMRHLAVLDAYLAKTPFFHGASGGLTDFALFPFVRQYAATDPKWFDQINLPHLREWLNRMMAGPLFVEAMIRHPLWISVSGAD
jgi:glutathione S-transferase